MTGFAASSKKSNARLQEGHLEKHGCGRFSCSLPRWSPSSPCTLITAQAPPHLLFFLKSSSPSHRNAEPFFQVARPHHFSFHMSGCATQQSFVSTCWAGFSVLVPGVRTNGLRTEQGVLCTSLPGAQRPLYRFYTKIFLLRSLLSLVWKLLTTRGGRRSVLHFTSNTILNRRMTTSGESFLYRLVGFWVNQF